MKKNRVIIIFIVLLSIVCILITSGFIYLMVNEFNFNTSFNFSTNKKMNLVNSYETLPSNVESINFKLYSTDIEIKKSVNDKVLVEYYSNLVFAVYHEKLYYIFQMIIWVNLILKLQVEILFLN